MRNLLKSALLGVLILTTSNCATIVRGSSQEVPFHSNPAGALVLVNGMEMGQTPTTLKLKRDKNYQIVFRLDGYDDMTINMEREFKIGAAVVGNIFSFGLIGLVVDITTGSAYQLTPEQVNTTLRSMGTSSLTPKEGEVNVVFFTPAQAAAALGE